MTQSPLQTRILCPPSSFLRVMGTDPGPSKRSKDGPEPTPIGKGASQYLERRDDMFRGGRASGGGLRKHFPTAGITREGQTVASAAESSPPPPPVPPRALGRGGYLSDEDSANLLVIPTEGGEELMVSGGETALIARVAAWWAGEGHEGSHTHKHWSQQPPAQSCRLSNWLSGPAETFLSSPMLRPCTPPSDLSP